MSAYERFRNNAQRIQQLTSPVRITDIMVAPVGPKSTGGNYLGEFEIDTDNVHLNSHDLTQRIGDHIEFLANMANKEHEHANFQLNSSGEQEMKAGAENDVTRLSLNEFSFYPKDRPLTLEEYNVLLTRIREIAENCHENLHLLLASFPVVWPDNKVYNIVVHVQCGAQPELYPFAKSVPSAIDAIYPQTTNPSFIGSSYYPKVLSEGINLTIDGNTYPFDDVVTWTTNGGWTDIQSIDALNDIKTALQNDKYCPPPQSLLDCIDATILAYQNNSVLTTAEVDTFKKEMAEFKKTSIEESDRFQDAVNLILPKPSIITNGIITQHDKRRFSFQQTIDYILSCNGKIAQNAQALEMLEATKLYIEQGIANNSTYIVDPDLINTIDGMVAKLKIGLQPLDISDVTNFKSYMDDYNESCQQTYYQGFLKIDRPGIFTKGSGTVAIGNVSFDDLADNVKARSKKSNYFQGRALLLAIKKNIQDYNNKNAFYAPDSTLLLAHINAMLPKYKSPFVSLPANDFTDLEDLLKQYKLDCDTRYSNHVRSIMPEISAPIGKTVNYAEKSSLTQMANLVQSTLDDPKQRNLAHQQLDYLRDNLLFSNEERTQGTKHPLLEKVEQLSAKLDKLEVAVYLQQQYDNFKGIDTTLKTKPLDKNDFVKINQCVIALEDSLARLQKHFPGEDTTDIRNKIEELIKSLPYNQILIPKCTPG